MSELPPGFVLDAAPAAPPPAPVAALPPGFVLDQPEKPSTIGDIVKSAGIGVVKGGIGLAGLPGDLTTLGAKGIDAATRYVSDKLGVPQEPPKEIGPSSFGSEAIQKGIEGYTGKFYEPKTTLGQYAQTAGEFLPAVIGGPESIGARLATRVAAPAIASETAGQLTKGTAAEPVARMAGAILGGAGGVKALAKPTTAAAPSLKELGTEVTALYNHPEVKGLQIKPQSAETLSNSIQANLLTHGVDDITAPQVVKIIDRLKTPRFGPTITVEDLDGARKALANVSGAEQRGAAIARSEIDNYLGAVPQADLIAGDAAKANNILLEARANAAAKFRDEAVQKALSNAEINTASTYSGGNIDNATRQQLKPILKNILKTQNLQTGMFKGWTPEEVMALRSAVLGNPIHNLLRGLGKMGPSGGLMGGLHIGSAIATGGQTVPLTLAGLAAKKASDYWTAQKAARVSELLRSRSPLAQKQAAAFVPPPASDPAKLALTNAALSLPFAFSPTPVPVR